MTNSLHHCADGGAIVHDPELPPAWMHWWTSRPRSVLCTALVCVVCKAQVRWRVGLFRALESEQAVVARIARSLHAGAEWRGVDGVEPSASHTLYACECFYISETSASTALWIDPLLGEPRRNLPWACSGHPVITLPCRLGDAVMDTVDDWWSALDRLLTGGDLLTLRDLLHGAADGPLEDATRSRIWQWARQSPFSPSLRRLLAEEVLWAPLSELVEEVIKAQTVENARRTLERRTEVAEVLATYALQDGERPDADAILTLLEAEAESLVLPPAAVTLLRWRAPAFLLEHLERWLEQRPDAAGPLLAAATELVARESYDADANARRIAGWIRRTGLSRSALLEQTRPHLMPLWADRGPLFERALDDAGLESADADPDAPPFTAAEVAARLGHPGARVHSIWRYAEDAWWINLGDDTSAFSGPVLVEDEHLVTERGYGPAMKWLRRAILPRPQEVDAEKLAAVLQGLSALPLGWTAGLVTLADPDENAGGIRTNPFRLVLHSPSRIRPAYRHPPPGPPGQPTPPPLLPEPPGGPPGPPPDGPPGAWSPPVPCRATLAEVDGRLTWVVESFDSSSRTWNESLREVAEEPTASGEGAPGNGTSGTRP